ncbi:hypothetical protein TEK04_18500 [Klenkia sp. LSe6-5]|uniref:Uncharacterized protein n=1 Tax=Klenkia sesuvii TaxID=3103137 RepID=A0ABU8DXZ9_9ACTN
MPTTLDELRDIAPIVAALVASASLLVAFFSFRSSRQSLNQSRAALLNQVRTEWTKLRDDWRFSIILARGSDDYYSMAPKAVRESIHDIAKQVASNEDWSHRQAVVNGWAAQVGGVVEFLDYAANLVLSGRLTPADLYGILGPEVTRHGRSVRWMIGYAPTRWNPDSIPAGYSSDTWLSELVVASFAGRQDRILALIDLLWAQLAKSGDHEPHVLAGPAMHKRATGDACRRRVRRLGRQLSGRRTASKLESTLLWSEFLPPRAIYQDGLSLYGVHFDYRLTRTGLWRVRAYARVLRSRFELPASFYVWRRRVVDRLRRTRRGRAIVRVVVAQYRLKHPLRRR